MHKASTDGTQKTKDGVPEQVLKLITQRQTMVVKVYDVHTEGEGSQAQVDARGYGQAPCGRPHRKLKLESTDVILSSSYAKKLMYFFTVISSLDEIKNGKFSPT